MIDFLAEARALFPFTQALRRDFHSHPELGFNEIRTADIVIKNLGELGLEIHGGISDTGVVAILAGSSPGPVILLRADMDALPITEETGAEYASQNPGVMHACGHDAHTAILLTAARILHKHRQDISGTVKFMFQPAEEGMGSGEGGMGGAEKMIEAGVLENPKVDMTLGLHVWNEKPVGWFGIAGGPIMAGAEIFKLKITGEGGHAAAPHLLIDPILAASQVISALQGIVSRNVAPLETAVISVCTIHAGEAFNVMPSTVEMSGTIRTFDPEVRQRVLERFEETVKSISKGMGCEAEIDLQQLTLATINQMEIANQVQDVARDLFPNSIIDTANKITMGSEDFAFILEKVPGCFFFIGSANHEKGLDASHHHPKFDIDESALVNGTALMAAAAFQLGNKR